MSSNRMHRRALLGALVVLVMLTGTGELLHLWRRPHPGELPASAPVVHLAIMPTEAVPDTSSGKTAGRGLDDALLSWFTNIRSSQLRLVAARGSWPITGDLDAGQIQQIAARANADDVLAVRLLLDVPESSLKAELYRKDGSIIWGAEYFLPASESRAGQQSASPELVSSIVQQVESNLQMEQHPDNPGVDSAYPQAHEAWLRGRYSLSLKTVPGYWQAIRDFEEATAIDPQYARAYAGISEAWLNLAAENIQERPALERARQAALTAIRLDDRLAEAHRDLAWVLPANEAEEEYQRALALGPQDPRAHMWYAQYLASRGRFPEALAEARKAVGLDPLSLGTEGNFALMLIENNEADHAIAVLRQADLANPGNELIWGYLGLAYARKGQHRDAEQAFRRAMTLSSAKVNYEGRYACEAALSGDRATARRVLLDLLDRYQKRQWVPAYGIALTWLALGDRAEALRWLARAAQDGSFSAFQLATEPLLAPLRNEQEFRILADRVRRDRASN